MLNYSLLSLYCETDELLPGEFFDDIDKLQNNYMCIKWQKEKIVLKDHPFHKYPLKYENRKKLMIVDPGADHIPDYFVHNIRINTSLWENDPNFIIRACKTRFKTVDSKSLLATVCELTPPKPLFSCSASKCFYSFFRARNVFDPCPSFGERLLAAVYTDVKYTAVTQDEKMFDVYDRISKLVLRSTVNIFEGTASECLEDIVELGPYDLIFTECDSISNELAVIMRRIISEDGRIAVASNTVKDFLEFITVFKDINYVGCLPFSIDGKITPVWILEKSSKMVKPLKRTPYGTQLINGTQPPQKKQK